MEVHYNIAALPSSEPIPIVTTGLDLWFEQTGNPVEANLIGFDANDLRVAAGDADGSAVSVVPVESDLEVYGVVPHMHIFGTAFYATVRRADGSEECLISIPNWRFLEQRVFFRPPDRRLLLQRGDSISVRCEYDNSYANQPLVRGVRLEPRDLTFGWRSIDEMCQMTMLTVDP